MVVFLKTRLRQHAIEWIESQPKSARFHLSHLYNYLKGTYPQECDKAGLTADGKEPKYEKDARWAVQDCKFAKGIRQSRPCGYWERV